MKLYNIILLLIFNVFISITLIANDYKSAGSFSNKDEFISYVNFGSIVNHSGSSKYSDFTKKIARLKKGQKQHFIIKLANSLPSNKLLIWIDWNHDKDFDDKYEKVFEAKNNNKPFSGKLNVPNYSLLGKTRMRIRLVDSNFISQCKAYGNSFYGEVEDYSIIIKNVSCTSIIKPKGNHIINNYFVYALKNLKYGLSML
jgi:hypothetical protein